MKCLIIAAGKGSRLRSLTEIKPLVPLNKKPLIERVIDSAMDAGVNDFYVVVGYKGSSVRAYLEKVSLSKKVPITVVENEEWERANGISVLKAKSYFSEPFLLTMGDHIFDAGIARLLIRQPHDNDRILLAVDEDLENSFIDMEDVTRVWVQQNQIKEIGKGIKNYNCFDTGIFLCGTTLFKAIEESSINGDDSLSGGVRFLAKQKRAQAIAINGLFWCDIDEPKNFKQAEEYLSNLAENVN